MKKIILILFLAPFLGYAQHKSCCKSSSTEKFASLASNESFVSAHLDPEPFVFESIKGSMISFAADDEKSANGYFVKADFATNDWIFVFHEWWGLNDYIKRETEQLSNELPHVNILAVDLYDGIICTTAEKAQQTMQSIKDARARAIVNGAMSYAGENARIGTIGWCFGGGWSLQASIMAGKKAVACVMYYGFPETDTAKLKTLNTGVIGIFATKDDFVTPEIVKTFEKNMKSVGKKVVIKNFDAVHAFANPSNPQYDKQAAGEAKKISLAFFKSKFR